MGFFQGVIAGVAVAAGAAAWYMSRSGKNVREQYRLEQRLGELGDQLEARTRDIQGTVNAQIAELRSKADDATASASTNGHSATETMDAATATAAEAAAEVDAMTTKVKKAAKDVADGASA